MSFEQPVNGPIFKTEAHSVSWLNPEAKIHLEIKEKEGQFHLNTVVENLAPEYDWLDLCPATVKFDDLDKAKEVAEQMIADRENLINTTKYA